MSSFLTVIRTARVRIVVRCRLVSAQLIVPTVLSNEKCLALPPIALGFAKDDYGTLPVVSVVVVVGIIQTVDDAPGCVAWTVDAVDVHRERSASHQRTAVGFTAVGIATFTSCHCRLDSSSWRQLDRRDTYQQQRHLRHLPRRLGLGRLHSHQRHSRSSRAFRNR